MTLTPCPCGRYQIEERESICPYCGILLVQFANTQQLDEGNEGDETARWGTGRFHSGMDLLFRAPALNRALTVKTAGMSELVLGRQDEGSPPQAMLLDTSPLGGIELGVSRHHASILLNDDTTLQLIDHNSSNGTFLNGQRLTPGQARMLRDGDQIRIARLVLNIHFQRSM